MSNHEFKDEVKVKEEDWKDKKRQVLLLCFLDKLRSNELNRVNKDDGFELELAMSSQLLDENDLKSTLIMVLPTWT